MSRVLLQLGPEAYSHSEEVEEIKYQFGIDHDYFDCWIYTFLENKKFDIDETVAKLVRRADMEREQIAPVEITDAMRDDLSQGVIQYIGDDKSGRPTLYVQSVRDFPTSEVREMRTHILDAWVSWGARLRKNNQTCKMTLLVNQRDASFISNTDITFQANIALRISKFWPGVIDRIYVCCMSPMLSAVAKPFIRKLPAAVSDRVMIFTERDINEGALLERFEENVLPSPLGGKNDRDNAVDWRQFSNMVLAHYANIQAAIMEGKGAKEYELECILAETAKEEEETRAMTRSFAQRSRSVHSGGWDEAVDSLSAPDHAESNEATSQQDAAATGARDRSTDPIAWTTAAETLQDSIASKPGNAVAYRSTEPFIDGFSADPRSAGAVPRRHIANLLEVFRWQIEFLQESEQASRSMIESLHDEEMMMYSQKLHQFLEEEEAKYGSADDPKAEKSIMSGAYHFALECPAPVRALARGFVWAICVFITIYFVVATIFWSLTTSAMIVLLFLSIYLRSFFVFPLGFALLLVGYQSCLIATRGIGALQTTLSGALFPPVRQAFGAKRGFIVQYMCYFALLLIQFLIFLYYSATLNPLSGASISFAVGWIFCSVLVLLAHILYPVIGFVLRSEEDYGPHRRSDKYLTGGTTGATGTLGSLSLYLFLNMYEGVEEEGKSRGKSSSPSLRTSSVVIITVPTVLCLLFGIAFISTGMMAFVVALTVTGIFSAFALSRFNEGTSQRNHSDNLVRSATWLATIYWMYVVFSMGYIGYIGTWRTSIIFSSIVMILFSLVTIVSTAVKPNNDFHVTVLRIGYGFIALMVLVAVAVCFTLVHWALGLFSLLMLAHCLGCFTRPNSVSTGGVLTVSSIALLLFLAVLLLGNSAMNEEILTPAAVRSYRGVVPRQPFCLRIWNIASDSIYGSADSSSSSASSSSTSFPLRALDLSLINHLSVSNSTVRAKDMALWFPTLTYHGVLEIDFGKNKLGADVTSLDLAFVHKFTHNATNTTILSFAATDDQLLLIQSMTMYVEAIAFAPLSMLVPYNWTANTLVGSAFLHKVVPLQYHTYLKEVQKVVRNEMYGNNGTTSGNTTLEKKASVILTGHSFGGGIASIVGALVQVPTVAFSNPGLLYSRHKFGVSDHNYRTYVMSITTNNGALSGVDYHGSTGYAKVDCTAGIVACQHFSPMICALLHECGNEVQTNRSFRTC